MSASRKDEDSHGSAARTEKPQEQLSPPPSTPKSRRSIPKRRQRNRSANEEERLRRLNMLMAKAEQLANIGSWELDVKNQTLLWSDHFFRMMGLDPREAPIPLSQIETSIHPDDRERAQRDLDALISMDTPLDNEVRFVTASGAVRLFHSRAIAIRDETGQVVLVRGKSRDITGRAETKLRESESLLSQAEEIAHLGSWEFDVASATARVSKNLRQMYGLSPEEEFSRELYLEHVHAKDRSRVRRALEDAATKCEPFEFQLRYILPKGETRFLYMRGHPVAGPDGKTVRLIGVVQDITDQKRMEEHTRQLWRQMIQGRDEERRRMARELHESAGQSLAALKMNLARLYESLPKNRRLVRTLWRTSAELTEAAAREVRTMSYLMHPPLLDEAGLAPALRWYARGFAERSKILVRVDLAENFGRVSRELEITVFRVVQEALTNVHRYSGSGTARIRIWRDERELHAEVQDEGCGLAIAGVAGGSHTPPGVGIAGMRERVQQLNGTFDIDSVPGKGTTVRITLPIDRGAKQAPANDGGGENLQETGTEGRRKDSLPH